MLNGKVLFVVVAFTVFFLLVQFVRNVFQSPESKVWYTFVASEKCRGRNEGSSVVCELCSGVVSLWLDSWKRNVIKIGVIFFLIL